MGLSPLHRKGSSHSLLVYSHYKIRTMKIHAGKKKKKKAISIQREEFDKIG